MRWNRTLLLATILATQACASTGDVDGDWAYRQACAPEHSATLSLRQSDEAVTGSWSDGDGRGMGEAGDLTGVIREGRVYLQLCTRLPDRAKQACPDFGEERGYLKRQGDHIVWFRRAGANYEYYLTLQRIAPGGQAVPDTTGCDMEQGDEVITDRKSQ